MKNRRGHGEFMNAVAQTGVHIRTARRLMQHARECDEVNRLLPYHPNKSKGDTVSLLEPPADPDEIHRIKMQKPRHDSEPLAWSAAEGAQNHFEIFIQVHGNRKIEEMEDMHDRYCELFREYIDERREDRSMLRHGSGAELASVEERITNEDC